MILKVFSNLNDYMILYKLFFKRKYLGLFRVGGIFGGACLFVLILSLTLKPADLAGKKGKGWGFFLPPFSQAAIKGHVSP